MLSSADADLVRRDLAIPGLAVVLDPDAFVAALRRAVPEADVRTAQITYLTYKPRAYCRVCYRLDVAGGDVDLHVGAYRPEDLAKLAACNGASVAGPLGPGRLFLTHCALLVTVFPNDMKLVELRHLADPAERDRVLRELLPDRSDLWQCELRYLRYRPERRFVAELRAGDGARAVLKSYTRTAYMRGRRNATAFEARGPLRLARLLGCSERRRLLAFDWLPGRTLLDLFAAPEIDREGVRATGAALAALHDQHPDGLEAWTREDEVAAVVELAQEVGFVCPRLSRRAEALARRLGAQLANAPAMHLPIHGDFSATQVLVAPPEVAIIDLDWACRGDPADDLGHLLAQAERQALDGERPPSWIESLRAVLLDGYGRATTRPLPDRIRLYTARGLFRRARFPIRTRNADWPQRTEQLLERAEAVLNRRPQQEP